MAAKYLAFIALVFAAVSVGLADVEEGDVFVDHYPGVRNLTRATLDDVRQGDWVLVIVAQWCGYSQSVVGMLPSLSYNLKQTQVAVIDGEEDPSVYIQFSLDSFPFICYVHNGVIYPFDDIPTWERIMKWGYGEWSKATPLTGFRNPFGWQMTLLGAIVHFLWIVYDFIVSSAAVYHISGTAAFGILFGLLAVTALLITVCCIARYDDEIVMPMRHDNPKKNDDAKPEEEKKKKMAEEEDEEEAEKKREKEREERKKAEKAKAAILRQRSRKNRVE